MPEPLTNPIEPDGSIASVQDVIGDLVSDEMEAEQKAESGQQPEPQEPAEPDPKEVEPEAKTKSEQDPKGENEPVEGEDEDEYFEVEVAGEDGADPTIERYKSSEVWEGFQKANDLQAELERVQKAQPMPSDIAAQQQQLNALEQGYIQALQQWEHFNPVQPPNEALIDPNSDAYNPEAYNHQLQAFKQGHAQHEAVKQELARVQSENQQRQEALRENFRSRERAKLQDIWPEVVTDKSVAEKVKADLEKHYGLDGETIASVLDARFYALAKDALAHRSGETARKEAVRVVKSKPKLIRSKARNTSNPAQARMAEATERLAKSGSLEDAAAAIEGLI